MGMLGGHCFYIKSLDVLTQRLECEVCRQSFTRREHLTRHKENECKGVKTKIICRGKKVKRMVNSSDKAFYGGASNFSYAACQWIEAIAEQTGRHIHHALCGHGGERQFSVESGKCKVDGYEPITKTVYEFNGCKWHGCPCQSNRTARDEERYIARGRGRKK